jgi:TP901 family phage tail tape measure protein
MPVRIPVEATRLEQSIIDQVRSAGRKIGKKGGINLGTSAKSIESLSQPLGRITGKADQFTKSMEAANARVLAFGASVGVLSAVTKGFKDLVTTTIEVEKSLASINAIMGAASNELERFKKTIFDVARNTEQSFATVAEAALEFSRQGLSAQKVVERLNDSMILARLSGLGASEAVAGLTAAINSFNSIGIKSSEVLNKLSAAAASAAVSERDLIEGIKRSGAVAIQAGVEFDELVGVISAVQEKTARGGAVIGNSFKTIFTRLQSLEKLKTMRDLGVEVTDASGAVLSATKLITNLGQTIKNLPSAERLQIAENLVGKFQVAPFLAILEDMSRETSRFAEITQVAGTATDEAYTRNIALNKTLAAAINEAGVNLKELANTLGEIGVTESLKNILGFFNSLVTGIKNVLEGEGIGSDFARGIVKGIGNIISGPGLAIFAAIIAKLTLDLIKFGGASLKTFFGIGSAAKQIAQTQGQIAATLLNNKAVQDQILKIENSTLTVEQKRVAQTQYFTAALNTQLATMQKMQAIAARVAPGVVRGTTGGRKAAGGFIPNFDAVRGYGSEQVDINRGVGGAPPSARPVTIPNFAFGNGKRGTITANTSEFIVPNFAGGGSAIFNQDMVKSMGLPSGARKIGAAGGYIPNFAKSKGRKVAMPKVVTAANYFYLVPDTTVRGQKLGPRTIDGQKIDGGKAFGLRREALETASDGDENLLAKNVTNSLIRHTKRWVNKLHPLGRKVSTQEVRSGFEHTRGAKGAMAGAIGSAFEVGITKALDYKAAAREKGGDFDVRGGTNLAKVQELFGFPPGQTTGDFKVAVSPDSIISFYKKVIKERRLGTGPMSGTEKEANIKTVARQEIRRENKGMFQEGSNVPKMKFRSRVDAMLRKREKEIAPQWNYAGGYIPNFANASPLAEAIQRESQAGLPINQIRINQTSRLRNAGNPMGLAVTNMRDEPTGKVPNFAKKPMGGEMGAVSGDLMMKFMGLTMAAQMLQGMFSQMGEETSNFSKGMGEATNAVMMMAMMAMMGGGKMGFAPLAAGPWSQKGGSMIGSGMAVFGGGGGATRKNPMTGMVDSRTRAAGAGRLAKVGGGLRVAGGVGLKGISLFGRLLPVIGQLLFAFQALSGVVKMFGGDLGGSIKEFLTPLGVALNLVDTPAEKTAKALDKLGDQAYKTALASGFQETAFDDFFKNIRRAAAEENVRAQLGDKVEKDEDALAKKLKLDTQREAVKAVEDDVMEGLGVKMVVGTFNTPGQAGRDEFTATFAGDLSREEIRKKIDDTIAARRTALPQSTIMTNPKNFTTFRESTRRREEEERFQEEIAEKRREAQTIMRTGSIDEVEEFIREGDVTGILSATQKVALGQLRSTALGAFGSREENQALADIANMGGDTTKQQERMIAAFDPEEAKLYKEIQDEIRTGKLTELEVEEKINAFLARRAKKTKAETQQAKIQESLAKARLKNMVELTTLQVKMTTQADLEAKTKLSLLSTSAKEKVELQAQVEARKRQRLGRGNQSKDYRARGLQ